MSTRVYTCVRAPTSLRILASLRAGRSTVGILAADLGVTRRAIERALHAITAAGLRIDRERDALDHRIVWLRLAA